MFWNFKISLDIFDKYPTDNIMHESFFTQRTLVEMNFSRMIFDSRVNFVQNPPIAIPLCYTLIFLLLSVMPLHLVSLSVPYSSLSICFTQKSSHFSTLTIYMIELPSSAKSVTMTASSVWTGINNLRLSSRNNRAFFSTASSRLLKLWLDNVLGTVWDDLAWCETLCCSIIFQAKTGISQHWLPEKLSSIKTNITFGTHALISVKKVSSTTALWKKPCTGHQLYIPVFLQANLYRNQ